MRSSNIIALGVFLLLGSGCFAAAKIVETTHAERPSPSDLPCFAGRRTCPGADWRRQRKPAPARCAGSRKSAAAPRERTATRHECSSENLEGEVNRLNRALGFQEQSPFQLAPAEIISRDNATWWNTCTIDRGARDELATDMAVVTEAGLVGKLTGVSRDISRVLLISDESLRVSVEIEGTQEKGIISGTPVSSNYAPDLRIRFLSKTANIKPGMRVVTAGRGGVFPSGVLVGVVKDFAVKELEGVATVTPAVDLADIKDVFVIRGGR